MRKLETLNGVRSFDFSEDLIWLSAEGVLTHGSNRVDLSCLGLVRAGDKTASIKTIGNYVVWIDKYGSYCILRAEGLVPAHSYSTHGSVSDSDGIFLLPWWCQGPGATLIGVRSESGQETYVRLGLDTGQIIEQAFPVWKSLENGTYLFGKKGADMRSFWRMGQNGKLLWRFDCAGNYKDVAGDEKQDALGQLLSVIEGKLWLTLRSGRILSLDIETGATAGEVPGIEAGPSSDNEGKSKFRYPQISAIDTETHTVFSFSKRYLSCCSLSGDGPRWQTLEVEEELKAKQVVPSRGPYLYPADTRNLYFSEDGKGRIGRFDLQSNRVTSLEVVEAGSPARFNFKDMRLHRERLYVLDSKSTLHIYDVS